MARKRRDPIPEGIVLPFRRGGNGVITAKGPQVTQTQILIVVGTTCKSEVSLGDLPYNQALGTLIDRIKHSDITDPTTRERALVYVKDKLKVLVPTARLKGASFSTDVEGEAVELRITFDALDGPNGRTVEQDITEAISL